MANIEEYLMTLPLPIGSYMLPETDDGPARMARDWADGLDREGRGEGTGHES